MLKNRSNHKYLVDKMLLNNGGNSPEVILAKKDSKNNIT